MGLSGDHKAMNPSTETPTSRMMARMVPFRIGLPSCRGTGTTLPSASRTHSSCDPFP